MIELDPSPVSSERLEIFVVYYTRTWDEANRESCFDGYKGTVQIIHASIAGLRCEMYLW